MLLRSSSTPVLGSLLSSFSDSPNSSHHHHHHHQSNRNKLSFHQSGSLNFTPFSCNQSPISPSVSEFSDAGRSSQPGFRRAQSEGNLEGLLLVQGSSGSIDEFTLQNPPIKFSRRPNCSALETIPSFSARNSRNRYEEDEDSDEEEDDGEKQEPEEINQEPRYAISQFGNHFFDEKGDYNQELYLAKGLGVMSCNGDGCNGGGGGGRGGDFTPIAFGRDGGDGGDGGKEVEEQHYKKMVEENPGNSLFLRNYAHYLYQSKQDLRKAEEYYSRAILADPADGEILSQYAKLIWELHRDKGRALSYFQRSVQASSQDSHAQAAYASFLWEIDDEDDDEDGSHGHDSQPLFQIHEAAMSSVAS